MKTLEHLYRLEAARLTGSVRRVAAQVLGVQPITLLLDASQEAPAQAPAQAGLTAALSSAGSLVNQTVSGVRAAANANIDGASNLVNETILGVRANLQNAAAGLNLTVSQVLICSASEGLTQMSEGRHLTGVTLISRKVLEMQAIVQFRAARLSSHEENSAGLNLMLRVDVQVAGVVMHALDPTPAPSPTPVASTLQSQLSSLLDGNAPACSACWAPVQGPSRCLHRRPRGFLLCLPALAPRRHPARPQQARPGF